MIVVPLARLALARAARWPALLVFAALVATIASSAEAPSAWLGGVDGSEAAMRGLAREAAWTACLVLAAPWFAWRSARAADSWSGSEAAWLVASGVAPARAIASVASGLVAAAVLAAVIACAAGELAARGTGSTAQRIAPIAGPPERWCTHVPSRWTVDVPATALDGELRVACTLELAAGEAAACETELVARRGGREARAVSAVRERGRIEVDVPAGQGPLALELRALTPGDRAFVPADGTASWRSGVDERLAGAALCARIVLGLAALSMLALGIGSWTTPLFATLSALGLAVAVIESEPLARFVAGADVFAALDDVARGRVPAWTHARELVGTSIACAAGFALARAGYRREDGRR